MFPCLKLSTGPRTCSTEIEPLWTVDETRDVRPLVTMKDRLAELDGLDDSIMALDFDGIVERNVDVGRPSSTDAIIHHGDWTLFVEFKGGDDPPDNDEGDRDPKSKQTRLKHKAAEAVYLYDGFLSYNWDEHPSKRCLIVVTRDGFSSIRANVGDMADKKCFCPKFLERYASRDRAGNRIFYDRVCAMSSREFVAFVERELCDNALESNGEDRMR